MAQISENVVYVKVHSIAQVQPSNQSITPNDGQYSRAKSDKCQFDSGASHIFISLGIITNHIDNSWNQNEGVNKRHRA
jgi:hypothetical protein